MVEPDESPKTKIVSALPKNTYTKLQTLRSTDIIAGIPSYNCAHTINYVIYQTAKGLAEFFPDKEKVIVISDGGSSDGTIEVAKSIRMPWDVKVITTRYVGTPGKGTALRAIFEALTCLDAQAVMVVDSDLRSIVPEWVELLVFPTLKGTDLVTPLYARHKYDGTITNFLCYPFTRALYGQRIRQPIGGDFGLSRKLVATLLKSDLWNTAYVPKFGIDIFETHTALGEKLKVKQAFLGSKIHEAKDPSKQLAPMFHEVLGAMFSCMRKFEKVWRAIRGSQQVEMIKGTVSATAPEEVKVDAENMLKAYNDGFHNFTGLYRKLLDPELMHKIQILSFKDLNRFEFPNEYWAKCAYSFAAAFKKKAGAQGETLLEALRVLWIGKVTSFILETREFDLAKSEKEIERESQIFEELKPFLTSIY